MSEKIYWIREASTVKEGKTFKGKPVACVVSCLTPAAKLEGEMWNVFYSVATQNPEDNLDKRLGANIASGRLHRKDVSKPKRPEVFRIPLAQNDKSYAQILNLILTDIAVTNKKEFPSRVVRNAQRVLREFSNKAKEKENVV